MPGEPRGRDLRMVGDEVAGEGPRGDVEQAATGESVEGGAFVDGDVGHDLDGAVEDRTDVTFGECRRHGDVLPVCRGELAQEAGHCDGVVADAGVWRCQHGELGQRAVETLPAAVSGRSSRRQEN